MTFAKNLVPDEAPQNVGLHLRSKLFDNDRLYICKILDINNEFLQMSNKNRLKHLFLDFFPIVIQIDMLMRIAFS